MLHCFLGNPRSISFPEEVIWCWIIPQNIPLIVVSIYPSFSTVVIARFAELHLPTHLNFIKKSNLLNLSENVFKMKRKVHFTVNHTEILIFIIILWTEMEDGSFLKLKLQDRVQIAEMNGCLLSCINLMHFTSCSWPIWIDQAWRIRFKSWAKTKRNKCHHFPSASRNAHANGFTSHLLHYWTVMNPEEMKIL